MAGPVQSIERAAAILRLLAGGSRRMGLGEVASSLGLAKGTAHGILRTLQHVDFVEQHPATGKYLEWRSPLPADFEAALATLRG